MLKSGYDPTNSATRSPNHGKRGPDKNPRPPKDKKSFAFKYYEKTGRTIQQDMKDQQSSIDEMKALAKEINDPEVKFQMIKDINTAQDKYNRQWAPYLQSKLGVIQTDIKDEDTESLDDILDEE